MNRRSYISVTGKPSGAQITEKDPIIRWGFNIAAYLICAFVILLYATIVYGSFSFTWGVDFTPTLRHWSMVATRGVEAILDTTFLSALATPFAAFLGMVIAWLVVRKNFSGKEVLDFTSNLGGAVPADDGMINSKSENRGGEQFHSLAHSCFIHFPKPPAPPACFL